MNQQPYTTSAEIAREARCTVSEIDEAAIALGIESLKVTDEFGRVRWVWPKSAGWRIAEAARRGVGTLGLYVNCID